MNGFLRGETLAFRNGRLSRRYSETAAGHKAPILLSRKGPIAHA